MHALVTANENVYICLQWVEGTENVPRLLLEMVAKGWLARFHNALKTDKICLMKAVCSLSLQHRSFDELEAEMLQGQKLQVNTDVQELSSHPINIEWKSHMQRMSFLQSFFVANLEFW